MKILFVSFTIFLCCSLQLEGKDKFVETQPYETRIKNFKFGVQAWSFRKFSFYETLNMLKDLDIKYLQAYPGQVLQKANPNKKFGHHLSVKEISKLKKLLKQHNIELESYGVVGFENNLESMEPVFEFSKRMGIKTIVTEPYFDDYSLIEKMVKKYNIRVAIHNHPPPTKYAYPSTVLKSISGFDKRIGACPDIGHWLRTDVDIIDGLKMLEGRIFDVHMEDLDEIGSKNANTVVFGKGKANIRAVLAELTRQNYFGMLSTELEQEKIVKNPVPLIRNSKRYVEKISYYKGWEQILTQQDNGKFSKHGWNHYGPGYFDLDSERGELKSQKGMGLFWYSKKRYSNFVLELEFKVDQEKANSGIFLRIPDVPINNDYVEHSFEVQICNSASGVYGTGAIFDAKPAINKSARAPGEWNHYQITFRDKKIKVVLNDVRVNDWIVEPKGKIIDFSLDGYIGFQNHDWDTEILYKNIYIKELP